MTVLKMTDLDLKGKRVLIREDLNVPVKDGQVHILYFDGQDNDLRVADQSGGAWSNRLLAGDGALGYHNEAVQLKDGTWWTGTYNYSDRKRVVTKLAAE